MMRRTLLTMTVLAIIGSLLTACRGDEIHNPATNWHKGAKITMKTYCMGRFALDVPVEMKQAVQAHAFRGCEIEEVVFLKAIKGETARENIWSKHEAEIRELDKPEKVQKIIIELRDLTVSNSWSKAVFYYGNYISNRKGTWDLLVDAGDVGVWFKYSGLLTGKEDMFNWVADTAKAYMRGSPGNTTSVSGNLFFLKYGAINLPYFAQEKTYSRFEGHPLDLKLEVEMNETHEVEKLGVAERLAASIAIRFAPGVDVDKIRSRNRTAAGLNGEELVMRMSASGEDSQIQFGWEYRGKVDSGEHPEIQITMESPDGNLKEKLKVWDAILDSFKPMYR